LPGYDITLMFFLVCRLRESEQCFLSRLSFPPINSSPFFPNPAISKTMVTPPIKRALFTAYSLPPPPLLDPSFPYEWRRFFSLLSLVSWDPLILRPPLVVFPRLVYSGLQTHPPSGYFLRIPFSYTRMFCEGDRVSFFDE